MVIFDYKYRGGFERHVNISYFLCSAGGDIQIRPSKFGGSFNQPNVPTIFENVCFNHIIQIKSALGISGVSTEESLWSKKGTEDTEGAQIDLIIERKDNVVNMCEIKFYSDEFTAKKECHFSLVRRERLLRELLPKKISIQNTLITTFGLKRTEYFGDFMNTITLDDLFQP